jgi:two-component system, NtrC family, nitrogen regulation response regulator GlnG
VAERTSPPTDVLTPSAPEAAKLLLVVRTGPSAGAQLMLEKGTYRVGKSEGNDLVLQDRAVSGTHLVIEVLPGGVRLKDNGSTNGSYCEGMRFTNVEPRPGAVILIGRTHLLLSPANDSSPRPLSFGALVGSSPPMRQLFSRLARVAPTDTDVLIEGETGTGKDLCAQAIHAASGRRTAPLVVCDLASISPTLFESELFGHVKGAFTGALSQRAGAFERANGGTLFLDEIGDLPEDTQPRLLRALEQRQVKRVGANVYRTVDVRVIAATNRHLEADIASGRFREDLYHRLAVVEIRMPPLRERPEDIPPLVDALLAKLGKEPNALTEATRSKLAAYPWPGNVRELRNVVERAVSLGSDVDLEEPKPPPPSSRSRVRADRPFKEAKDDLVGAFERDYVADLLAQNAGNISKAARQAGIDRVHLYRLVKKHGIQTQVDKRGG